MKFVLFVEGKTERNSIAVFLKRWLDAQLNRPVGIQSVKFQGWADFVRGVRFKAQDHLTGPRSSEVIAAIGLLDLYGLTIYPQDRETAQQRIDWGRHYFEKVVVNQPGFHMHFAVHEYEAWLLSQPTIFPRDVQSALNAASQQPEAVNHQEPPAKLLERVYPQTLRRNYKKTVDGPNLFQKLDPEVAVQRCPQLRQMLGQMLKLAQERGL